MPSNINCPTCMKKHNWNQSKPWSPFCSERCKLIDLGAWASEKHVISSPSDSLEQLETPKNPLQ